MGNKANETHIFDLDGTLATRDTFLPFLLGFLKFNPKLIIYAPFFAFYASLFFVKAIDNQNLKESFLKIFLTKTPKLKIDDWAEKYARRVFYGQLNEKVKVHMESLKKLNAQIVIATASPDIYVNHLAKLLSINNIICSKLETDPSGQHTGKLKGKNCYGIEKRKSFERWMKNNPHNHTTFFYTDHHSDLPLLATVDHGILVNPDKKLRTLEKKYNFFIFEEYIKLK